MEYVRYSNNVAKIKNFRNYRKVNNKNKFRNNIIFVLSLIIVLSIFSNILFAKTKLYTKEITVNKGTTIWDIANNICKNDDTLNIQNVVIEIKELNNLHSSVIYDGQKLLVYEY